MADPGTPRQGLLPKVKNAQANNPRREADDHVSSTSLDKEKDADAFNGTGADSNAEITQCATEACEDTSDTLEEVSEITEDFKIPAQTLPPYNAPEKIIIVYDSAIDEVSTGFTMNGAETICPTVMLKRSLRFFLHNKHLIDSRHEFALVVINGNSLVWVKDFTNDIETILETLEDIPPCETEDILVLDYLFELISSRIRLPDVQANFNVPPPFVVRVLFTYGRSYTMPRINKKLEEVVTLVNSPYFTFDILMTHEMPSATNNCIKIFKDLQMIDNKGFAYFLPVGRSESQLHFSMAKLLGHPLQRAVQKAANYTINAMEA